MSCPRCHNENKYDNLTCDFCMAELPMSEKRKQEIEKKHKLEAKATEVQAIIDKYMAGDKDNYVGVTSATKNTDNKEGQLVVATNAEFAPWEYVDGDKYYGIDMEIAQILANELGLELVIDDMAFESVVSSVGNHGVDTRHSDVRSIQQL